MHISHFTTPFRVLVSGSSAVGKTTFIVNLLLNKDKFIRGEPIKNIIWCCRDRNYFPHELKTMNGIVIHEGLIPLSNVSPFSLVVYDDLMLEIGSSKEICELLTVNSSHKHISVIVLSQNLYHQSTFAKTMQLNFTHNVVFNNYRDRNQIKTFLRQVEPNSWRSVWEKLYMEVLSRPHAYLVVDFTPRINDIYRFKTNIFNSSWFEILAKPDDLLRNASKFEKIASEYLYFACFDKF